MAVKITVRQADPLEAEDKPAASDAAQTNEASLIFDMPRLFIGRGERAQHAVLPGRQRASPVAAQPSSAARSKGKSLRTGTAACSGITTYSACEETRL